MAKPTLTGIVQGLVAKGKAPKPKPLVLLALPSQAQRPLADLLGSVLPPPTQFETEYERSEVQRALRPWDSKAPDPRRPWAGKGQMEAMPLSEKPELTSEAWAKGQEKIALDHAIRKAKLGQRLTFKDRKLLGRWELARIMARVRPKGGDYG